MYCAKTIIDSLAPQSCTLPPLSAPTWLTILDKNGWIEKDHEKIAA